MNARHSISVLTASLILVGLLALPLLSSACGDDEDGAGNGGPTLPAGSGNSGESAPLEREAFEVTMTDNTFDPSEFTATGGTIAEFNITNSGTAIHNMRIAGADKAYNTQDDGVSDPSLVNSNEDATMEWVTPSLGGAFDFRCDFHPETMVGTITVVPGEEETGAGGEGP
jgi:plastocyanin